MIAQILGIVIGYLAGTIPVAYLLLRLRTGRDIRGEGSGNVGAMNAYEVSGVLWVGITTGVLDIVKGVAAVMLTSLLTGGNFMAAALAAFFVVVGHNYNVFLGFRGGRGLAPAAGAMCAINPLPVLLFVLMWATGYIVIRRNVHIANVTGALGTAILIFNTPVKLLYMLTFIAPSDIVQLKLLVALLCVQILVRHIEPLRALLAEGRDKTQS